MPLDRTPQKRVTGVHMHDDALRSVPARMPSPQGSGAQGSGAAPRTGTTASAVTPRTDVESDRLGGPAGPAASVRDRLGPVSVTSQPVEAHAGEIGADGRAPVRVHPLQRYQHGVVLRDLVATLVGAGAGAFVHLRLPWNAPLDYVTLGLYSTLLVGSWLAVLALTGAYDRRVLGNGSEEFKRVLSATLTVFAVIAGASYLARTDVSRALVLVALPSGLILVIAGRMRARAQLTRRRNSGVDVYRTLIVGEPDQVEPLVENLDPQNGYLAVGHERPPEPGLLDRWLETTLTRVASDAIDAVALTGSTRVTPEVVRRLSWALQEPGVDLLVAPALGDVAGPRLTVRPDTSMPLLLLDEPMLTGPKRAVKRVIDVLVAVLTLLLLSPILLISALAIRLTSRGPVLYVQRRVGLRGEEFTFPKLRTMVEGAHRMRSSVIGTPDGEIVDRYQGDPRITSVGRVLRRWSIDEVPQLWCVLGGSMSLVGPRPMLPSELPLLGDADHRRHLTKPGMTGLWQVNGRKNVAWDERMRLDLQYVERWSLSLDVVILLRTVKAVLTGHGAF